MKDLLKRLAYGAAALGLLALEGPLPALSAYFPPSAAFGPLSGDCTTASAGSTATTCTKSNGTPFAGMAFQVPSAVAITGGSGAFGSLSSSGPVSTTGDIGATQSITTASGTVSSTAAGTTAAFVYVNNPTAAVALAGPTNLVPGSHFTIKDGGGAAQSFPITYTPGSGITIDGSASYTLNINRQGINVWVVSATVQAIY